MTLSEVVIATAIVLSIFGGVFAAVVPAQAAFARQQERADLQQRLRVAVDTMTHDLRAAASVRPYRIGAVGDDGRAGVFFRPGTLSVRFVQAPPGGPPADSTRTFFLRVNGATSQLMRYDGQALSFPVLDDVVALGVDYFGVPEPPAIGVSPDGPPRATYGPTPPALGVDDPGDGWSSGENCTFAVLAGVQRSRLAALGGADGPLAPAVLTDGPWCPDAAAPDRFDADLLRVNRVRVRLRLQAPSPFRGAAGALFINAGTALDPKRHVPDEQIQVDVALRNWNAEW